MLQSSNAGQNGQGGGVYTSHMGYTGGLLRLEGKGVLYGELQKQLGGEGESYHQGGGALVDAVLGNEPSAIRTGIGELVSVI